LAHPGKLALFDKPVITESDARDFCAVNLSFMREVLALPAPSSVRFLRWMFSSL